MVQTSVCLGHLQRIRTLPERCAEFAETLPPDSLEAKAWACFTAVCHLIDKAQRDTLFNAERRCLRYKSVCAR